VGGVCYLFVYVNKKLKTMEISVKVHVYGVMNPSIFPNKKMYMNKKHVFWNERWPPACVFSVPRRPFISALRLPTERASHSGSNEYKNKGDFLKKLHIYTALPQETIPANGEE